MSKFDLNLGDLVKPNVIYATNLEEYGIGVVLDAYEDENGVVYYCVQWNQGQKEWWSEHEIKVFNKLD